MKLERQKILIDIDDTLLRSSDEIIRQLNNKNGTSKTIKDLTDYEYLSIDPTVTQEDIRRMYASDEFFDNVKFNSGAIQFLKKYSEIFDIVFVSYGTDENIKKKIAFLDALVNFYNMQNVYFVSCPTGICSKSDVLLDHVYLAIDNHSGHLEDYNDPKKILLRNYLNVKWNQPPINDEITYVADTFYDIIEMIDFDLKLKDMGVWLDA